ncbi:MAG: TlpA family protein disulfide reductase [Persicimonas sp.]
MDRLRAIIAIVCVGLVAGACDDESSEPASRSSGRVNAVQAKSAPEAPEPEEFCDVYDGSDAAPEFAFPELADDSADAPDASAFDGWRWVNVWASWCVPCAEEMPLLAKWDRELDQIDLVLMSTDETAEQVDGFRKKHPKTPESLRIAAPDKVKPWFETLGADRGAPLPVHIFVDPADKVRCVRAGGVDEDDLAAIERLLAG